MTSKTAVAPIEEAPVREVAVWEGFESDGTEDIAPSFPIIKIVQATSAMQGASKHAGDFFRSDTEEYVNPLEVVPLFQKNTRAFFKEGGNQPLCRSDDGIAPARNQVLWQERGEAQPYSCEACPFSQWGEDGSPPACRESIVVMVDAGDGDLAQLRLGGKSMQVWRRFVARKLRPKKLPLCSQKLSLTTVEKSEPGKKWQELVIDATPLSPVEAAVYNAVLQYERSRFEQAVRETAVNDEPQAASTWETPTGGPIPGEFSVVED